MDISTKPMKPDAAALEETLRNLTCQLLDLRTSAGHWEGELSGSALSTATAVTALYLADREAAVAKSPPADDRELVWRGWEWLVRNQNEDGGWGDTTRSVSNISTTALCWAAVSLKPHPDAAHGDAVDRAAAWLERAAGGLDASSLSQAIARRYGKDRTFSVPILTMLALAGRLGPPARAWQAVPQLPFELAALPHRFYKWVRLPVVSYALPALIAIGQVRHHHRPTRNPVSHLARQISLQKTLRVLTQIQPTSGGFLEAVPLTSFVAMSLVGSGRVEHPVCQLGLRFLRNAVRADGCWPIDTNLATWVTTLSVSALSPVSDGESPLSQPDRTAIRDWLIAQQYREVHPYTNAPPGAWAWTDLPGGVPDADDTAGALIALRNLGSPDDSVLDAARSGISWLLDIQNRDGGIPTFCKGWGNLPFDRSGPDLTAHAISAWLAWRDSLPATMQQRISTAVRRAGEYLAASQKPDGSWLPLWFGNQHAEDDSNPVYGTARVLAAVRELASRGEPGSAEMQQRGVEWLLAAQNDKGGWGGAVGTEPSLEETGLALGALSEIASKPPTALNALSPDHRTRLSNAISRGSAWIIETTAVGSSVEASPIGFYFARLWYWEALYPLIFGIYGLRRAAIALRQ